MTTFLLAAALAAASPAAGGQPLPMGASARFGSPEPQKKERAIGALAFSPNGLLLAAGAGDGSVRLYAAAGGREVRRLSGHQGAVSALAFSPDGRVLASGGEDHRLLLHDARTGRLLRAILPGRVAVSELAFTPDGRRVISSGARHNLEVWDVASGANVRSLTQHPERILGMALSPDGSLLATSSDHNSLYLWDAAAGRRLFVKKAPGQRGTYILDLAFSGDGGTLIARDQNNDLLYVIGVPAGERFERLVIGGNVGKLLPRPKSRQIGLAFANASWDKWSLDLLDPSDGRRVPVFRGQAEAGQTLAFSPDGKYVAAAGPGGTGLIWPADAAPAPAETAQAPIGLSTAAMSGLMASWSDPARAEAYFDEQRRRYAESEGYDPYGESTREQLDALRGAVEDEDFQQALTLAAGLLEVQPVFREAHELAAAACLQLGDKERARFHQRASRGLADSVRRSGDGKTPATAFRTVYMDEQEDAIAGLAPKRHVLSRSTLESGGRHYDAWRLGPLPTEGGEPETVYFDITPLWEWGMRRFGATP